MAAFDRLARGVTYAFTRGMDPRAKDGVRAHPMVFVCGMLFHTGIAASAVCLFTALLGTALPSEARIALILLTGMGAASGLVLLARRLREPLMQAISIADDYISNLLVVSVLVAALAFLLDPGLKALFLVATALLVLYAPFGKIRHCVLFFVTRARFGAFIGTRGVLVRPRR